MLKNGEFSKLSHLTVKALRFYEKEGLLLPAETDRWTGYRYYETEQLSLASKIKKYRMLDLSIEDIKRILKGEDERAILQNKRQALLSEKGQIDSLLSSINSLLEEKEMKYAVTQKVVPKTLVYTAQTVLKKLGDITEWIPTVGEECLKLNPDMECQNPPYEFCEYPDFDFKEEDVLVRHNEAVTHRGVESDLIKFREIPETKVLSVFHKGPYDTLCEAYAFLMKYAEENGYRATGLSRECYIDGIWNKETPDEWLTEIQLPIA